MTDIDTLERVGRAICRERCALYGDPPCVHDPKFCQDDENCESLAKAAIQAMQEAQP